MNDDLLFEYLLQMGGMQPEQQDIKRKQAMVDALRQSAMNVPQGQMIGKHYVPPSLTQYAAQLGQGFMAGRDQSAVDQQMRAMNAQQRKMLEDLRKRKSGQSGLFGAGEIPDYTGYGTSSGLYGSGNIEGY